MTTTAPTRAKVPRNTYVTIWKDPESTRGGLLTYGDGKRTATRGENEVAHATNPAPRVLANTDEDRDLLDRWLAEPANGPLARAHPYLAVPAILARDVLGWDLG